ncbi:hypothetical protein PF010_g26016 [Phytophthora fragariae]|uniref:Uncharacterized protein n=1 Tax=Phytophthora fragariae TaxID=53985 RepID=A0A6A3QZX0_9STRA|nr:hypothetical protein PF010_g26016 [Phytophthora fragariae]KAE9086806.1 hypothetical protein PF006_g25947 [Phytophthora fragariae]KAE9178464.1 hypothetical protein PF004_g25479 [Phytophthora fragariae]
MVDDKNLSAFKQLSYLLEYTSCRILALQARNLEPKVLLPLVVDRVRLGVGPGIRCNVNLYNFTQKRTAHPLGEGNRW